MDYICGRCVLCFNHELVIRVVLRMEVKFVMSI